MDVSQYYFMHWIYPFSAVTIYLAIVAYCTLRKKPQTSTSKVDNSRENSKEESDGGLFGVRAFMFIHNILLFGFSLITFCSVVPYIARAVSRSTDLYDLCCIQMPIEWEAGLNLWAWAFYMSKYWEFIDTFIILYRGGKASVLQVYHHAGVLVIMWCLVLSNTVAQWVMVSFNAAIHTLMYAYFALRSIRINVPFKIVLTMLQIAQFVIGGLQGGLHIWFGCQTRNADLASVLCECFVASLIALFTEFAYNEYFAKKKTVEQQN